MLCHRELAQEFGLSVVVAVAAAVEVIVVAVVVTDVASVVAVVAEMTLGDFGKLVVLASSR